MILVLFALLSWHPSAFIVTAALSTEDFTRAAEDSLVFLGAQRSGVLPQGGVPSWRFDSGQQYSTVEATWYSETTASIVRKSLDLSGGYYSGGEVGPIKVTTSIATVTTFLAWSALEYPDFWTADPERMAHMTSMLWHGAAYVSEAYVINPFQNPIDPTQPAAADFDYIYYLVRLCIHPHFA